MFMYFDPMYLIIMLPALILAGIASAKTQGTFKKYSRVAASSHLTGSQAARRMLDANGLHEVDIRRVRGFLSDHYNPANRTLNLSPDVYETLRSLWWDKKGDWDTAHTIAQEIPTVQGSAVHAYLHREEGVLWNADYWYSRAGRKRPDVPLEQEWASLAREMLKEMLE